MMLSIKKLRANRRTRAAWLRPSVALTAVALAACQDSPMGPSQDGNAEFAIGSGEIEVVRPTEGEALEGVIMFEARLSGARPHQYTMYWQVDGGALNGMQHDASGYAKASVDVGPWNWRGTGPYAVTFVAQDRKGRSVAQRTLHVTVGAEDTTSTSPPTTSANPLAGAKFFVDPYSNARRTADEWKSTRPEDAAQMEKVAAGSQADWFGDWNTDIRDAVDRRTSAIHAAGALPVFVAYNIPLRDCGSYSSGGATSPDAYRAWIRAFADGIGTRRAAVILEPDALAAMSCLSSADQDTRVSLIRDAVQVLKAKGGIAVYVDAGHSSWIGATEMASRLTRAGVEYADGFALNVSNFQTTLSNADYGTRLSAAIGGKHFVIDTSRNGLGSNGEWCNPDGRALGTYATADTGHSLVDALLWLKKPGESDGTCNGGPKPGAWWAEYALGLAQRMPAAGTYAFGG